MARNAARLWLLPALMGGLMVPYHAHALTAEVKDHKGSPTLFVNGQPTSPLMFFGHPGEASYAQQAQMAAAAGIHIHSYVTYPPWPSPGQPYDFSRVDAQAEMALQADPGALLLPRVEIYPPQSWYDSHPNDRMVYDDGQIVQWSMASEAWRQEVQKHLRAYVRHFESKYGDRVLGYHPNYGEWFYLNSGGPWFSDFSPAYARGFASWVRRRYPDLVALREAWNDPTLTFDTVTLPTREELLRTDCGLFRDPRTERKAIDFFAYKQVAMVEAMELLARVVKEETQRRKLVCFFYGYTFEMSHITLGPQDSGHLGLQRVLASPDVDILCAPISYFDLDRRLGGVGSFMCPVDSVRAAGKLWLNEDDTRTYLAVPSIDSRGTQWVHKRNFAQIYPRRLATWYMDLPGTGWLNSQDVWDNIAPLQSFYQKSLDVPASWAPEVAVIVDEVSPAYAACTNALHRTLLTWMRPQLFRMGAPFGLYLLSDLVAGRAPSAKAYIFLNCFHLDKAQRRAIRDVTRGRTAVWFYGGGFLGDEPDDANLADAVGMRVSRAAPQLGLVTPEAHGGPLTAGVRRPFGTATVLEPAWAVDEPGAEVIGRYANGAVAAAACQTEEGLRVYLGALHCSARLLRNILKHSGVHLYVESDAMVQADGRFLAITATAPAGVPTDRDLERASFWPIPSAGRPATRRVYLPQPADVFDALTGEAVAHGVRCFEIALSRGETRLYCLQPPAQ